MTSILILIFVFGIVLKFFAPKKPNYFFGYQLGSARKSVAHWKEANIIAANCMILISAITLLVSFVFSYRKYDGDVVILGLMIVGFVVMYLYIEKRLRKVGNATSANSG